MINPPSTKVINHTVKLQRLKLKKVDLRDSSERLLPLNQQQPDILA